MSLLKLVWNNLKGLHVRYFLAVFCIILGAGVSFLNPLVLKGTIDAVLGGKELWLPFNLSRYVNNIHGVELVFRNLWIAGLMMLVLTLIANTFNYLKGRLSAQVSETFACRLRGKLYDHIQRLPFSWHSKVQTGDIIQRCTSDVDVVRRLIGQQLVEVGRGLIMAVLAIPIMLSLSPKMTYVSLIALPFIFAYAFVFFRKVRRNFKLADEAEGFMTTVLEESIAGIRIVKSFARQDYEISRFNNAADDYRGKCNRLITILAGYWATSDSLCMFQICGVLIYGVHLTIQGQISLGTLLVFNTYVRSLLWPIREMGRILTDIGKASVSLNRIREILMTQQEEMSGKHNIVDGQRLRGELEFDNVSFAYEEDNLLLKEISLTVKQGEIILFLGATGAGKSTLMHLLPRLFDNYSGTIKIDGIELKDFNRQQLRRQIGIVMQEPFLFSRTIAENIGMALHEPIHEDLEQAAMDSALHESIEDFEEGYETLLGEKGITLSGGQRQRLAMARALVINPSILILDDSLSAVDAETERMIQDNLRTRKGQCTTLIISHRLTSVAIADRICVMEHGKITQMGTHVQLIEQDGLYQKIWSIQHALEKEEQDEEISRTGILEELQSEALA